MKVLLLICVYLGFVTLPLLLSWIFGGPPRGLRQELASGLGILAFSIILAEFVLSGRFKRLSRIVGMDVTMRFHQLMARTALVFALLHPLLYRGTPSGGQRPWDPTRQLTPTTDFTALASGIAAYLLLAALVILAIARSQLEQKYETWRLMHGLGALFVALLLLHHTVEAGRYGAQAPMIWFWSAMTALAAGTLALVYGLRPLMERRRTWRVRALEPLTPKQWQLTVSPDGHSGLDYKAGQFVWLNVGHSSFSLKENPFSIASAPAGGSDVSFLIKEAGDFTARLPEIAPGTIAYLDGPYGSLSVEGRREPGIGLIAGGVGLAPLLSILRQLRLSGDPRHVRLVYGNRTEAQIAFREELEGEDVIFTLSEPPADWQGAVGVIDAALLDRVFSCAEVESWVFVICGPAPMMQAVEEHLIRRGTPSHRILSERFDYD
jgi:predicted ferric reductase